MTLAKQILIGTMIAGLSVFATTAALGAFVFPEGGAIALAAQAAAALVVTSGAGVLMTRRLGGLAQLKTLLSAMNDGQADAAADIEPGDGEIGRMVADAAGARDRLVEAEANGVKSLFKTSGFDQASSAMMMADADGKIVDFNDAFRKLFAAHVGEFAPDWKAADVEKLIGQPMDAFCKGAQETLPRTKDKASFPFQTDIILPSARIALTMSAVPGPQGEIAGYYLELENITLRARNLALLKTIEGSQAVVRYDLEGRVVEANKIFLDAMGVDAAGALGKRIEEFSSREFQQQGAFTDLRARLKAGETVKTVLRRRTADGVSIYFDSIVSLICDRKGKPTHWVEIGADVSATQRAIEENQATLEAIDHGVAIIEFEVDGTIKRANEKFLATMRCSLEDIQGKKHAIFMPGDQASTEAYRDHWRQLGAGEAISGVFERKDREGGQVFILGSYAPVFDRDGKISGVVKVASNVTEVEKQNRAAKAVSERAAAELKVAMDNLREGLSRLAQGDLRKTIDIAFAVEYEPLRSDFNDTVRRLGDVVSTVVERSEAMETGATEVNRAAGDLARRTESQAASLQETTASLKVLTDGLKKSAEESDSAEAFTSTTADDVQASEEIVSQSLEAMKRIEESSEKISQIIGVIDDIAFQTNLLALNAGVEAARAGEGGRGFAVVAAEVRALAQRCTEAATEIKGLITVSSAQVKDGVSLATKTGDTLGEIIGSVSKIKSIVGAFATGSREQASSVAEIMSAMAELDSVTQSNAAMVEEMTAASGALSQDVDALTHTVGSFHINGAVQRSAPKPAASATASAAKPAAKPAAARPAAKPAAAKAPAKAAAAPARPATAAPPRRAAAAGVAAAAMEDDDGWEEF